MDDDAWIVELSYTEIAEYYPAIEFSPQQRVSFAAELRDVAENPVSPQAAIQALPVALTMVRLGLPVRIAVPIALRSRR